MNEWKPLNDDCRDGREILVRHKRGFGKIRHSVVRWEKSYDGEMKWIEGGKTMSCEINVFDDDEIEAWKPIYGDENKV